MRLRCGSSGFSYKEWVGPFYPEGIKPAAMLAFYASKLDTVEINNTFYRMPKASVLEGWAQGVPEGFRFVLKASQRITHKSRLKDTEDNVAYLWEQAQALGETRGPFLFQLPPYLRRGDERLASFLGSLPAGMRAAMEFRHASWFEPEVFDILRHHGAALVVTDTDDDGVTEAPPGTEALVETADFGYLRLRRESYDAAELANWRQRIEATGWGEAYVFFKHEDDGAAARLAMQMAGLRG